MKTSSPNPKLYLLIWAVLLVLLLLTWGVAQFDLGGWNMPAAMSIAVLKMVLVVLFFMHVRYGNKFVWVFVVAGFFWLMIMMTLTMTDYLSRGGFGT